MFSVTSRWPHQDSVKVEWRLFTFGAIQQSQLLEKVTRQQIRDNVNYLRALDQSHLWPDFIEFNRQLDISRNSGPLEEIVPKFKGYL